MKKSNKVLFTIFLITIILTGCATQSAGNVIDPPGFFHGLLHGFIIFFSFILSFFTEYEIYAFPNSGGWYDFGFLLGVMSFFGGGGSQAGRRRRR
jgi:hypothetical protein